MASQPAHTQPAFPWRVLLVVLLLTLGARLVLLASGAVSFHADEAVVGLMARHILAGERPTFFYGQPYMGSLDAWLVALGFRLLGQSVLTIRLVQSLLYLLVVLSGFVLAWRCSARSLVALSAGLFMAVPPVNVALYTTATLGGYNETLLLGSLLLLLGYDLLTDHPYAKRRWLLFGLCAGLGWWTNGLIVAYLLPLSLAFALGWLRELRRGKAAALRPLLPCLLLALLTFIIGSAPWWVFDFAHQHAALATFLTNQHTGEFTGIGIPYVPPLQRATGLLFIGLPTLIGLRFPWSSTYFLPLLGIPVLALLILAAYRLLRRVSPLKPGARGLVLGMPGLFFLVFVASTFGADPTGRYFLPLTLPLGILWGTLAVSLRASAASAVHHPRTALLPFVLLALIIGYNALGQISAIMTPPGLTTQFDPISHIPNDHDAELIAFLEANHLQHGFTSYWVAFRLAFLSSERLQYSSALPYKDNLTYNPADNRYLPYHQASESATAVAYITTQLPALDARLESAFAAQRLTYQQTHIGAFHIYYAFQPRKPAFEVSALAQGS